MSFLSEDCTFQLLSQELLNNSDGFDCGEEDLNDFFNNESVNYHNELLGKSYCFTLNENPNVIICAFTISNASIDTSEVSRSARKRIEKEIPFEKRHLKTYPAVLIGRLGVNKAYSRRGIGNDVINFIKTWFIDPLNKTGCRFIVVDAYNTEEALKFYELKNGFKFIFPNVESEKEYYSVGSEMHLNTRIMYYDLIELCRPYN